MLRLLESVVTRRRILAKELGIFEIGFLTIHCGVLIWL